MKNFYRNITALGIILCAIWVLVVKTIPISDFSYYNTLAKQIANGGSIGDTYTSVGYAIILAGIYKLFGYNLIYGKVFNLILTLINYILFYKILNILNLSEKRKRLIYTIFVLFPSNIFFNSLLGTEIIFTTILLLITLIYFKDVQGKYILIGVLCGINTIIKPFFIIFFFAIFVVELINKLKVKKVLIHSFIMLLVTLMVISPLVYRNTKLMGQFTFVSNNGGIVLYINNNSQNKWGRWMDASKVENSLVNTKKYKNSNPTKRNHMLGDAAKKWIKAHPIGFIILGFKRLINTYFIGDDILFTLNGVNLNKYALYGVVILYNIIRNILFIPSVIIIVKESINILKALIKNKHIDKFKLYALVCFYMFTSVYFITEGQSRYSFPFIFIIVYFFTNLFNEKVTSK